MLGSNDLLIAHIFMKSGLYYTVAARICAVLITLEVSRNQ